VLPVAAARGASCRSTAVSVGSSGELALSGLTLRATRVTAAGAAHAADEFARCARVQAALRGLKEELGIAVEADRLVGPLAPAHRRELHVPGRFRDCEFVETYRPARALARHKPACIRPQSLLSFMRSSCCTASVCSTVKTAWPPHTYTVDRSGGTQSGWVGRPRACRRGRGGSHALGEPGGHGGRGAAGPRLLHRLVPGGDGAAGLAGRGRARAGRGSARAWVGPRRILQ
jgi:hypothetical protein